MEIGSLIVGALAGWSAALVFDWLYYKQSKSFTRALDEAQDRIDVLQTELAEMRRIAAQQQERPLLFLESHAESSAGNAEGARVSELERLLDELRAESAETDRRARLFEARLTDASSELASLRYGLPTLDRKAEDDLQEIPRA